ASPVAASRCAAALPPQPSGPKLIALNVVEEPDWVLANPSRAAQLPLDGLIFSGGTNLNPPSGDRQLVRSVFGPQQLVFSEYSTFIAAAQQLPQVAPHLTDNYLRVATLPGTLSPQGHPNDPPTLNDPITMWFDSKF